MLTAIQKETELLTAGAGATTTGIDVVDDTTRTEFLPLDVLQKKKSTISSIHLPRSIATKNNILKLDWWHSSAQPLQDNTIRRTAMNDAIANNQNSEGVSHRTTPKLKLNSNTALGIQNDMYHSSEIVNDPYSHQSTPSVNIRHSAAHSLISDLNFILPNNNDDEDDPQSQDSQLLQDEPQPCVGTLNLDEEDEMKVSGFRRSRSRTFLCWFCICLTCGLLRLILHWWRHWFLLATFKPCPLMEAEKVLVEEDYQGKHKLYHVKPVQILNASNICSDLTKSETAEGYHKNKSISDDYIDVGTTNSQESCIPHLPVHFSGAHFKTSKTLRIFRCKQLIYAWDSETHSFRKINGLDNNVSCAYYHQQSGLSAQEQLMRRVVYGFNEITVPYRDVKTLLFLEALNPFYVFQIFSVILWFTYNYYYYACVILLMSIFGIAMSIIQTKKNQDVLRRTVLNTGNAWRIDSKGLVCEVPTQTLVPGDIIEIPSTGCVMQCDAVLLSGNCILDESMLTGESVPVTKTPLPIKRDVIFDKKEHARHTLFCGTKVIQTRYIGSKKVLAFVINTGNITAKGGLIRSILYPPPVDYKFEQDSYKFIQCLAIIACIGFIYTLVSKILRGTDPIKIAVESLDLITIVVPPALPAAMTVGRFYAQKRLKRNDIFCISPRSINVAGSIDCCCFDKTGTLTEDGLDMWGVVPKSLTNQFQIPMKQIDRLPMDHFLFAMVTCHSITVMNGTMMGDPLDLKMFESTGWILEDSKNIPEHEKYGLIHPTILRQPRQEIESSDQGSDSIELVRRQSSVDDLLANVGLSQGVTHNDHGIVREFPFTSSLQRMSVITRCLNKQGFTVYCKGSPEMLQQLCHPDTLPEDYSHQLSIYAKKGYRIIAIAYKPLSKKVNYTKAQRISREEVEHELQFLGFVILENRLKPDTSDVIASLNNANIRTVMVTGDNILTAISVARDCGIVSPKQAIITVHHDSASDVHLPEAEAQYKLQYTLDFGSKSSSITTASITANGNGNGNLPRVDDVPAKCENLDITLRKHGQLNNGEVASMRSYSTSSMQNSESLTSVRTCETWTHNFDVELGSPAIESRSNGGGTLTAESWRRNYRFAMDGKTWQIVRDHFPQQMSAFLTRGVIYARMSPEQKQSLIMELQKLDYCVAMCGDGANDCGALKVAHTGISLSETESSIASPFTSRKATIAAVPSVIREGRAALVTSFGIFKYMAAYSLVQFVSVMILYSIDSNLTDKQYLFIDLGLISIFAFFFGKTEAYAGPLSKQVPLSSLISPTPLASLLLHLAFVVAFQVAGWFYLHQQSWFEPFKPSDEDHLGCVENYTMFAISSFQYIILAFVFSKGAPYRRPIWSNWPFCLTLVVNLCIVLYLVVYPTKWLAEFFQLIIPDDMQFRYVMLAFGFLNFIGHVFIETIVVEFLIFQKIQARREQNFSTSKRKYMHVELDLQSYENWPPITEIYEPHESSTSEELTPKPTYINLSAEQNLEVPKDNVFPGFFEADNHQSSINHSEGRPIRFDSTK